MLEKEKGRSQSAIESENAHKSLKERAVQGIKEVIEDVPLVAANAALLGFGDEAWGRAVQLWRNATGDDRPSDVIYKEYRDQWRNKESLGRERSHIATFIADVATPNPLSKVKSLGPITTSAIQGYGYSSGDHPVEDTLKSAAIGGAVKAAGALGRFAAGNPRSSEAKYLEGGALPQANAKEGAIDIVDEASATLDRHRARGLFSKGSREYNIELDRYDGPKNYSNKFGAQAASKKEILLKMNRSSRKARDEVSRILKKLSHEIEGHNYEEVKIKTGKTKLKKGGYGENEDIYETSKPRKEKGVYGFEYLRDYDNGRRIDNENYLDYRFGLSGSETKKANIKSLKRAYSSNNGKGRVFTLENLQDEKQRIYRELKSNYKAVASGSPSKYTEHEVEAKTQMARLYKDFIGDMSGDPKVKQLNELMHDNMMFSEGLNKKYAKGFFGERTNIAKDASRGGFFNRIESTAENVIDPTRPYRATLVRAAEDSPQGLKDYVSGQGSALGGKVFNYYNNKNEPIEGLGRAFGGDREPDSIATEIVKTPLPRTTKDIIEKSDFVKAKLAQQAPELFDAFSDTLDNNPDMLSDLLPMIAQTMPQLFEHDKYDRIDGVILNPVKKEMARNDVKRNDNLSNTQKMMIINKLNKTGEFGL